MMNVYTWHLVVWFCAVAVCGTLVGQLICELYVRKQKRFSAIMWSIALILFVSMACLLCIAFMELMNSYPDRMGFMWYKFCSPANADNSGEAGILAPQRPRSRETLLDFFF